MPPAVFKSNSELIRFPILFSGLFIFTHFIQPFSHFGSLQPFYTNFSFWTNSKITAIVAHATTAHKPLNPMKLVYELKHGFISVTLSYIFSFFLSYIDLYPYISVLLAQKTINNFVLRSSYFRFLFMFWVSGLVAHAQLPIKRDKLQSCHDGVKLVEGRLRGLLLLIFSWVKV